MENMRKDLIEDVEVLKAEFEKKYDVLLIF